MLVLRDGLDVCFSLGLDGERESVASRADAQPMETRTSFGSRRRVGWPAAAESPVFDDELFRPEQSMPRRRRLSEERIARIQQLHTPSVSTAINCGQTGARWKRANK